MLIVNTRHFVGTFQLNPSWIKVAPDDLRVRGIWDSHVDEIALEIFNNPVADAQRITVNIPGIYIKQCVTCINSYW